VYVPGSWEWRDHYVWRPGYWSEYQPGRVWVAAHYRWTPAGCVFIDGYWDYPLVDRGVLFAPVSIAPAVYADPGFVYTPSYVVQESCLYGSLFCRRHFGCYYFGDYFSPAYASLGFTPWCGGLNLSVGFGVGRWYDPLFAYYRCGFRSDSFWGGGGIFDLYAGRYRGDYLRPPVNLVQQTTVINNITKNTTVKNVNVTNVQMVSSLNNVARSGRRNLQPVSDPARRQFQQAAAATREVASHRATAESELAARPGTGTGPAAPRKTTLDVPQRLVGPKPAGSKTSLTPGATPPRPTPTRIAPPAPKGGPSTPGATPGAGVGTGTPRPDAKPSVIPKGSGAIPSVGAQPPAEPRVLPKSPAGPGPLPKANVPPHAGAGTTPKTAPKADAIPRGSPTPPAAKSPAPQPPTSIPKQPKKDKK
jgi:hypothetical protein